MGRSERIRCLEILILVSRLFSKTPERVPDMVIDAVEAEKFLILTDEIV